MIVVASTPAIQAVKQATATIPIVMVGPGDPVGLGLIASLARPGGNLTGLSFLSTELTGKRLELLKEAFPKISRVAVLETTGLAQEQTGERKRGCGTDVANSGPIRTASKVRMTSRTLS